MCHPPVPKSIYISWKWVRATYPTVRTPPEAVERSTIRSVPKKKNRLNPLTERDSARFSWQVETHSQIATNPRNSFICSVQGYEGVGLRKENTSTVGSLILPQMAIIWGSQEAEIDQNIFSILIFAGRPKKLFQWVRTFTLVTKNRRVSDCDRFL